MILSAQTIRRWNIIKPCLDAYKDSNGNSAGLSGCGYDIAIDLKDGNCKQILPGEFYLSSAIEHFNIPNHVMGVVHDKSSLARRGLAVQNTVLEPGWHGFLTLEITNHGIEKILLHHNDAIAQVIFYFLDEPTILPYKGKYQDQERGPQDSR
jgi:dCTP deaminase